LVFAAIFGVFGKRYFNLVPIQVAKNIQTAEDFTPQTSAISEILSVKSFA